MNKLKEILSEHKERVAMVTVVLVSIILIFVIGIAVAKKNKDNEAAYNKEWHPVVESEGGEATTDDSTKLTDEETLGVEDVTQDQEFGLIDETVEPETTIPTEELKYQIRVNRAANCITIYTKDEDGKYTVPFKAIVCSTGKNVGDTPIGNFKTLKSYQWLLMVDGSYGQYAYRYYGSILFHSVPYFSKNKNDLEYEQFNKLGEPASLGCVRVCVRDAMWLIANCPVGTEVIVYDDAANPGPLGKPEMIKIPVDSPNRGWDPTDPDPENPWLQCKPKIYVKETVEVAVGTATADTIVEMLGITATDTCGNVITEKIQVTGDVNYQKVGSYRMVLSVKDAIGKTGGITVTLNVKEAEEVTQPTTTQKPTTQQPNNQQSNNQQSNNQQSNNQQSGNSQQEQTYPVELKVANSTAEITAGEYHSLANVFSSKLGLSATDSKKKAISGNIAEKVRVLGNVDINVPGTYIINLTITDSYGKTSVPKTVTIIVYKAAETPEETTPGEDPAPEEPTPEETPAPEEPTPEEPTPEETPAPEEPTPEEPTTEAPSEDSGANEVPAE